MRRSVYDKEDFGCDIHDNRSFAGSSLIALRRESLDGGLHEQLEYDRAVNICASVSIAWRLRTTRASSPFRCVRLISLILRSIFDILEIVVTRVEV